MTVSLIVCSLGMYGMKLGENRKIKIKIVEGKVLKVVVREVC